MVSLWLIFNHNLNLLNFSAFEKFTGKLISSSKDHAFLPVMFNLNSYTFHICWWIVSVYADSSAACNTLDFQLGSTAIGTTIPTRQWNIKVCQTINNLSTNLKNIMSKMTAKDVYEKKFALHTTFKWNN